MSFSVIKKIDLIIVLNDLTAEGCPILALDLIDESLREDEDILNILGQ